MLKKLNTALFLYTNHKMTEETQISLIKSLKTLQVKDISDAS